MASSNVTPVMLKLEDGHGFYYKYAGVQQEIVNVAIPSICELIGDIPLREGSSFVIGDFGCCDGGTSVPLMDRVIGLLKKKHGDDVSVSIIYVDQPANDFNSLFKLLERSEGEEPTYKQKYKHVFPLAAGRDFLRECAPPNTMHLAVSFTALHWIPQSIIPPGCEVKKFLPVSDALSKAASKCWQNFVLNRHNELEIGGYAYLRLPCVLTDRGNTTRGREYNYLYVIELACISLLKEGTITQEEKNKMFVPWYIPTQQDLKRPFSEQSAAKKTYLKLVRLDVQTIAYSFYEKNKAEIKKGKTTVPKVAREFAENLRGFTCQVVHAGLSDSRENEEKAQIVNRAYEQIYIYCTSKPEECVFDMNIATLIIKKVKRD